jgi:adenylate cyclase
MMNFTVMGDAVNLASRLEGANKEYGTRILIGAETAARSGNAFTLREIDRVRVVGQAAPQLIYEVTEKGGDPSEQGGALRRHYAEGLDAYRAGRWADARLAFEAALAAAPDDGPSRVLLTRVMAFAAHQPAGWDGTWQFERK